MTDETPAALKKRLTRIEALVTKGLELHALQHEIFREIQTVLTGGASTADNLRRVETHFKAAWHARYAPGETKRYAWQYDRDNKNAKQLLRSMPIDEIERRITTYLQSADPYFAKTRHTFGVFIATVNQHAAAADGDGERALELEAPPDCKHTPPCKSDQQHTKRRHKEMHGK